MNEQQIPPQMRIWNAIDQDLRDAKITLSLIEKLTDQNNRTQTCLFNNEELETLIRNCIHSIILNLTKTIEKPKSETHNLESRINNICHDEDQDLLKKEVHKIRGDKIYGKLVEYRHKIIAHRNIEYKSYQAIEQEFTACKDYLRENKEHIEKLIEDIISLLMNIKISRDKKLGRPDNTASDFFIIRVKTN